MSLLKIKIGYVGSKSTRRINYCGEQEDHRLRVELPWGFGYIARLQEFPTEYFYARSRLPTSNLGTERNALVGLLPSPANLQCCLLFHRVRISYIWEILWNVCSAALHFRNILLTAEVRICPGRFHWDQNTNTYKPMINSPSQYAMISRLRLPYSKLPNSRKDGVQNLNWFSPCRLAGTQSSVDGIVELESQQTGDEISQIVNSIQQRQKHNRHG